MHALNRGYMWTAVLAAIGFVGGTYWLLNPAAHPGAWWHFALCGVIGIATSIAFVYIDRKSTRLNSSHGYISYAVFCLKKKKNKPLTCIYYRNSTSIRITSC